MAGGRERLGERGGEAVEEEVIHRAATASRPLPQHLPGCSDPSWRADGQTVSSRKRHTVCVPDACERTAAVCQGGGDTQRERPLRSETQPCNSPRSFAIGAEAVLSQSGFAGGMRLRVLSEFL